jgi:hypothetical protein
LESLLWQLFAYLKRELFCPFENKAHVSLKLLVAIPNTLKETSEKCRHSKRKRAKKCRKNILSSWT